MTISFRETQIVVIETSRTHVRAGLGLFELLKKPSLDILARVGLKKSQSDSPTAEGSSSALKRSTTALDDLSVNDYLVGAQLDEAIESGQDIAIFWPFIDGKIHDWIQAEAIWKHVLFAHLRLRRTQNESPVILSIFPDMARSSYERISQIFFERYNTAGFSIVFRPVTQLYAANALNGVVIDVGEDTTDISIVCEGFLVNSGVQSTPIGLNDCQRYLANLLRSNTSVMTAFKTIENPEELNAQLFALAKHAWSEGLIKIPSDGQNVESNEDEGVTDIAAVIMAGKERAVIEQGQKKKNNQKISAAEQARQREIEALDLVTITFRNQEITFGKERHRFCEPLFNPHLLKSLPNSDGFVSRESVQDVVGRAVSLIPIEMRKFVWEGVLVTGELTKNIKGLGPAIKARLSTFILSNSDLPTDTQPRQIRILSIPEYFSEFRDQGDHFAAFLGTSVVAKVAFNDSIGKNFTSKQDYVENGPKAIVEACATLL